MENSLHRELEIFAGELECPLLFRTGPEIWRDVKTAAREGALSELPWADYRWRHLDRFLDLVPFMSACGYLIFLSRVLCSLAKGNSELCNSVYVDNLLSFSATEELETEILSSQLNTQNLRVVADAIDHLLSSKSPLNEMAIINLRDGLTATRRLIENLRRR